MTNLQLQDVLHLQLGPITEIEGSIFGVKSNTRRPYEFLDDVHTVVSYEFDLNMYRIDREAYNTLDWLGDLGGLKEALMLVLGAIITAFNYNALENYMVAQLYRGETKKDKSSRKTATRTIDDEEDLYLQKDEGNKLKSKKISCCRQRLLDIKDWLLESLNLDLFKKLKKSKEYRLFEKGRNSLEKEIDIVHFMQ